MKQNIFYLCLEFYYESIHKPCVYSHSQEFEWVWVVFNNLCTIRISEQTKKFYVH